MNPALRRYITAIVIAGAGAVLLALLLAPPPITRENLILGTLLVTLSGLTYLAPVRVAPHRQLVLHTALQTVALLVLPPGAAGALMGIGVGLGNGYLRRPMFNILFNAAQVALAVVVTGAVYRLIAPVSLAQSPHTVRSVLAVVPAGVLLFLISALAVDGASAIQRRASPFANWFGVHGPSFLPHIALVAIGSATATVVYQAPWLMLVAVAPLAAVRSTMQTAMGFDAGTLRSAEEIADAIEARHTTLRGRSRPVADLAQRLARASNLGEEDCQRIYLAARLHDVAAALVPDSLPDHADAGDDLQRVYRRIHAEHSAAYVQSTLHLHGVADILRLHHERFDGRGYPRGLRAQEIPLDARILAVCEAWEELTSATSYRPALTHAEALMVLSAGSSTQWDPNLVVALQRLLEEQTEPRQSVAPVRTPLMPEAIHGIA